MIEEKGPWAAAFGNDKAFVESDDFTHDVRLYINGDFESTEQKLEYAEEIAKRLNTFASRDAEVVSLTNQRDYEYVRAENAEQERDQLREQIASLKDELRQISTAIDDVRLDLTNTAAELIMEMKEQLSSRDAEVAGLQHIIEEEAKDSGQVIIERDQLREHVKLLQSAIKNLRDVKGRHHSEIAYKRLIEALADTEPKE